MAYREENQNNSNKRTLNGDFHLSFWRRTSTIIYILIFVFIATISIITFLLAFRNSQDAIEERVYNHLLSNNRNKINQFTEWIRNVEESTTYLAARPLVRSLVDDLITCNAADADCSAIQDLLLADHFQVKVDTDEDFEDIFIIDARDGRIISATDISYLGKYRENKQYFQKGLMGTYTESSTFDLLEENAVMHTATPIYSPAGKKIAVLVVHINVSKMVNIFQSHASTSISEDSYLVNAYNYFLTEPRFGDDYMLSKSVYTIGIDNCLSGDQGVDIYNDYRGVEVIGAYEWLPAYSACVVSEIDVAEAFLPIYDLRNKLILSGFICFFGFSFFGFVLSKRLTQPLVVLTEFARKVGQGNLSEQLQIKGWTEFTILGNTMNEMAANLKISLEQNAELINKMQFVNRELEDRVKERTSALTLVQNDLLKQKQELQRSNEDLQQFAYVASHDLQEPLRMVASFVQLLERKYSDKLDKDGKEYIAFAVDGSRRMKQLIESLLAYSRVGTRGRQKEWVDLNEIVNDIVEVELKQVIRDTNATVNVDRLPKVFVDGSQIHQVLQNLIGNGIKYQSESAPQVHLSAEEMESEWKLSVTDNGIGIAAEYFEKIFVIFQRLHTKDEYPGSGIGLAISKKIIERHGGRIWVESTLEEGSRFIFTLPKMDKKRNIAA